jgi:hypothetical protein
MASGSIVAPMLTDLTPHQVRTLVALALLASPQGVVETSTARLQELTATKSDSHLRASLKALEAKGYLVAQRRKRNRGMYTTSRYVLQPSPLQRLWSNQPPPVERRTTVGTDGYVLQLDSYKPLVPNLNKLISYENVEIRKDPSMNKAWREEQDRDSEVGGVGKFGDDEMSSEPMKGKKIPKTRGKRPVEHWTVYDVAAEFSYLVGKKFPWLPGTVNVNSLAGALRKMRSTYQTTALVELEILKMFMADESNFKGVGNEAPHLYKIYLAMFRTHMNQARKNLGLNVLGDATAEVIDAPDTLIASDGREFDNTIVGRKALERHEERLKNAEL